MGVLNGVKVLEFAGLAPGPFCGLVLADFGADVIRVDRVGRPSTDNLARGKRSIAVDVKSAQGVELVKALACKVDVIIDPFRPGVLEKLGLGPEVLLELNPGLIVARMTGFGQTGTYAKMAGHDINYIAVSGALSLLGRKGEKPLFPVNLLGDFAGGGMLCVVGILLALLERAQSGKGQVVDAAMVDGAAYLSSFIVNLHSAGLWSRPRGENMLDSGAHFYDTYATKDGKYVAVGAIEPQFYRALLKGLGIDKERLPSQHDASQWPAMKRRFADVFRSKTRQEWTDVFDGTDACVTPVVELDELAQHQHAVDRHLSIPGSKFKQEISPAPRLSRTPAVATDANGRAFPQPTVGEHTRSVLSDLLGYSHQQVAALSANKVVSKL